MSLMSEEEQKSIFLIRFPTRTQVVDTLRRRVFASAFLNVCVFASRQHRFLQACVRVSVELFTLIIPLPCHLSLSLWWSCGEG